VTNRRTYDVVDGVVVVVQHGDLAGEELDELLATAARGEAKRILVWVEKGTIASNERKKVADVLSDGRVRMISLVTDDRLARGAATAIGWFGVPLKAFASNERERALDALDLNDATRSRVAATLDALRRQGTSPTGTG
jgi:hypothetical protein